MEQSHVFEDRRGRRWSLDWDAALRVIRSFHRAEAVLTAARIESVQEHAALPRIHSVVVDWARARQITDQEATHEYRRWSTLAAASIEDALKELREMQSRALSYNGMFRELQAEAQRRTLASLESSVETSSPLLNALRSARDASGGMRLAGAAVLPGGSSALVGLDAAGKNQDFVLEHRVSFATAVGGSILQVVADAVFGIVPAKPQGAGRSEKVALRLVVGKPRAGAGAAQSFLEGDVFKQASVTALAAGGVDAVLEGLPIDRWAIPARITLSRGPGAGRVAGVHRLGEAVVGVAKEKIAGTAASFLGRPAPSGPRAPLAPLTSLPADGQSNADAAVCGPSFLDGAFMPLPPR